MERDIRAEMDLELERQLLLIIQEQVAEVKRRLGRVPGVQRTLIARPGPGASLVEPAATRGPVR